MHWFSSLSPETQLQAMAFVGAGLAFVIGLVQYQKAQRWKRAEWVAHELDKFFEDPLVAAALAMIDWDSRRVCLYPTRSNEED